MSVTGFMMGGVASVAATVLTNPLEVSFVFFWFFVSLKFEYFSKFVGS